MSWFDLGALLLCALAVVDGARSGLAWSVVETALLALAAVLTTLLRPLAEPYVSKIATLGPEDLLWVTHAALFALIACMLMGVAYLLHPLSKRLRFRWDDWTGGTFGVVSGLLAAVILFSMTLWHSPRPYEEQLSPSVLISLLDSAQGCGLELLFPDGSVARVAELTGR